MSFMIEYKADCRGIMMTKFMELYDIAEEITNIYDEMFFLTSMKIISTNSNEYDNLIEKAKILVLRENAILSNLKIKELDDIFDDLRKILIDNFNLGIEDDISTVEGIEEFLNKLSNSLDRDEYKFNIDVLLRIFNRLNNQTFILCGDAISVKLENNDKQATTYDVSLWDSIISILNIQTLKNIKDKIYGLVPSSSSDIKFIESLKYNLECSELVYFYATFMAEIFALYASNRIDNIVMPSIEQLKKLSIFDDDFYNKILVSEAKMVTDELANLEYLENNLECVFYFLRTVTSFEVLINNMNKNCLKELEEYCAGLTNEKNYPCMEGINKFIKKRIKREK